MKYLEEKDLMIIDEFDLGKGSIDKAIEMIDYTDISISHDNPNAMKMFQRADYVILFIRGEMKVMKHRHPVHIGNKKYW